jgi:type IV pilus assembly protein PilP
MNYIIKILNVICITSLFLYYGCNDQPEKPQKATVISKKIVMPKKEKQPIKKDQKIETSKPEIKKPEIKKQALKPKTSKTDAVPHQKPNQRPDQKLELSEKTVSYRVEGKIDPFVSIFRVESSAFADQNDRKKKKRIPLTPIEKVDLSQLKLVGIIFAPGGNKALVEDASGKGFVIKKGTRMGINSGRVIKILKGRVVVEEETKSILGEASLVKRELKLQKPPGEE